MHIQVQGTRLQVKRHPRKYLGPAPVASLENVGRTQEKAKGGNRSVEINQSQCGVEFYGAREAAWLKWK